jgi:hypothetical protein
MVYHNGFIGNTFNEWRDKIEDTLTDEDVVLDPVFGDRTTRAWIDDDFVEFAVNFPHNYPRIEYKEKENSTISPFGSINFHGGTYAGRPYSWYIGPAFDTLEKREAIYAEYGNPWDEQYLPPEEAFKEIKTKLQSLEERDYPWMPLNRLGSIWEYIFEGLGPRQIAYLSRKNPSALHQILEENMKSLYYCNERIIEEGAMVIGVSDDMGYKDHPLLSPNLFEEFLAPLYKRLTDLAHKHGAFFWLHSCGNITELLSNIIAAGVDAWQTLEPASGVDFKYVKETYGDKLTLVGGIDASRILPFGTKEEVIAHTRGRLEVGKPGGGYIAGCSHDLMDIPLENLIACRDTIREYGKY